MIHYWLQAVEETLTANIKTGGGVTYIAPVAEFIDDPEHNILVMPDGQPAAVGGDLFVAIHPGMSMNLAADKYGDVIEETYEIFCTVSKRTRNSPEDRVGRALFIETTASLTRVAQSVQDSIANVAAVKTAVESLITAESASGSVTELLRWSRTSQPVPRDKSWFMSNDPYDLDLQPAGYSCEITFVGGTIIRETGC